MEDPDQQRLRPEELKALMKSLHGERSTSKQVTKVATSPLNIVQPSTKKPRGTLNEQSARRAAATSGGGGTAAFNFSKALGSTSSRTCGTEQQTPKPKPADNVTKIPTSSNAEAERWRERGNDLFKSGKFKEAAACYSSSIAVAPSSAAYANRAMVHIKLKEYAACEADCTEALAIDPSYVKAYLRRATARRELGTIDLAIADIETALRYEPTNKAAAEDRKAYIASWIAMHNDAQASASMRPVSEPVQVTFHEEAASESFLLNQVSTKILQPVGDPGPVQTTQAVVHHIDEKDAESDDLPPVPSLSLMAEDQQTKTKSAPKQVVSVVAEAEAEPQKVAPVPALAAAAPKTPLKLKAPRNGIEFEREWKRFKSDQELQAAYLCLLTPQQLPVLLKQALTPPLLASIQQALLGATLKHSPEQAVRLLGALPLVPRFSMNVLSLSVKQKSELAVIWDAALSSLGADCKHTGLLESLETLRAQFKV